MFLAREQITGQNDNMRAGDKSFEIVTTPTNPNFISMKKLRGDLSRGMPTTIQSIIFCLPVFDSKISFSMSYGYETWFLTLRGERAGGV